MACSDYEIIKNLELELVSKTTRGNSARLSELITDDFEEISISGKIWHKQNIIDDVPNQPVQDYQLKNFRFVTLGNNCILVKYLSTIGKVKTLRSSTWIKTDVGWQMLHHQSTGIR